MAEQAASDSDEAPAGDSTERLALEMANACMLEDDTCDKEQVTPPIVIQKHGLDSLEGTVTVAADGGIQGDVGQQDQHLQDKRRNELLKELSLRDESSNRKGTAKRILTCDGKFNNQLMVSEWFLDEPEDFPQNWIAAICPVGQRCLLVARKGLTTCYSKRGELLDEFPSQLPGGNRRSTLKNDADSKGYTILDCMYSDDIGTFYVLDILAWNSHEVCDNETEFRFFWLQAKLAELGDTLTKRSRYNTYLFQQVPFISADKDSMQDWMNSCNPKKTKEPNDLKFQVDGILFYQKRMPYLSGECPLVLWIKPFMLAEVYGGEMDLPEVHTASKPSDYTDMKTFIKKWREARDLKKTERNRRARKNNKRNKQQRQYANSQPYTQYYNAHSDSAWAAQFAYQCAISSNNDNGGGASGVGNVFSGQQQEPTGLSWTHKGLGGSGYQAGAPVSDLYDPYGYGPGGRKQAF